MAQQPTISAYPDVTCLLDALLAGMQAVLGDKLVGFYLYGSLVWGEFDHSASDVDTLAVLSSVITEEELHRLQKVHDGIARAYPEWADRVEVQYQSLKGLRTFHEAYLPMGVISPGEPLHIVPAGKEWLLNWYFVRTYGRSLYGPPPETIIGPITKREFIDGVRDHALEWRNYIVNTKDSRPYQGYAILTLCRAYYTLAHGEQVSKKQAALWVQRELPEYARLISDALRWRKGYRDENVDPAVSFPATHGFVTGMIERIECMGEGIVR